MSKKQKKDQQDDTNPTIVVNAYPTPKQQVTSTAIQMGIALAIPVVIGVGVAAVSAVGVGVQKIKDRRSGKSEPFPASTDELPDLKSV